MEYLFKNATEFRYGCAQSYVFITCPMKCPMTCPTLFRIAQVADLKYCTIAKSDKGYREIQAKVHVCGTEIGL